MTVENKIKIKTSNINISRDHLNKKHFKIKIGCLIECLYGLFGKCLWNNYVRFISIHLKHGKILHDLSYFLPYLQ